MDRKYVRTKLNTVKQECEAIMLWFTDKDVERFKEYCQDQINTFKLLISKIDD